jgi:putative ABC transport system permease protein
MFQNYLKVTIRNLLRNKVHSFINIVGLSIGLACAILIILYVNDEVSFDRFHKNGNNIYRIVTKSKHNGVELKDGNTGLLQGPKFAQNIPGIETFVRVQSGAQDIKTGSDVQGQELLYVDSSFFTVFSFPLLDGDPKTCLKDPHSIVLSEIAAKKQFGTANAVGKIVMMKDDSVFVPYKVTAVAQKCPQNSSIQFDVLVPIKETEADAKNNENWFSFFLNTFVVLNPNAKLSTVESEMQKFYVTDATAAFKKMIEKYGGGPDVQIGSYGLQPFTEMHMSTALPAQNGLTNASNPMYSYILSGIALFILIIACINFVNLTVARSVKRAKEIGIRKVVGGDRKQLIIQFLGESLTLSLMAFVLALVIVQLILPTFNNLSNKSLSFSYLLNVKLIAGYFVLFLCTGILAGFYPALVLSGYSPVETLYNRFNLAGKSYLQKSLVVLQFSLASFLIIATFTIYAQFHYLTKSNLGFDDSNLVMVLKEQMKHAEAALFKNELLKSPDIIDAAPKNQGQWFTMAKLSNDSTIGFNYETIDESYIPELKIPLIKGRNFSNDFPADSNNSIIVNESFVNKAGWKNPIGQTVNFFYNKNEIYHVIGVVKDYHFLALNQKIGPQLFTMKNSNLFGKVDIKIKAGTVSESLKYIQKTFKQLFPLSPYYYIFEDQQKLKDFESEAKWKQIILLGAILTIFISCIGLFGLSVLTAEKRTKEIGIRKVLGASVKNIVTILSQDFLKLVFIAVLIAVPLGWLSANKWLQNYPYRINVEWWLFASTATLVIAIALFTVSFQAIKAAIMNPVNSLRTE